MIKIIIVDDHLIFRNGLKILLEQENIGIVVAEASNGIEFLEILKSHKPDLVLMDLDMPLMNGVEASEAALKQFPDLKILVLSMIDDYTFYSNLINIGVRGFISKSSGKTELEKGVETVINDEYYFSADLLRNVITGLKQPTQKLISLDGVPFCFTEREQEILKFICEGLDSIHIADKLFLSVKTIENQRSKMLQKVGVKNTIGLIIFAFKNKIISV
jgi:DNA-binding NarL/FixJ family response regulator